MMKRNIEWVLIESVWRSKIERRLLVGSRGFKSHSGVNWVTTFPLKMHCTLAGCDIQHILLGSVIDSFWYGVEIVTSVLY